MVKVGDKAPDFTLKASDGRTYTLSEMRGKTVVLYFYPKDDTPGCTVQACNFRDSLRSISHKAVLLGISRDDAASHKRFIAKYNLNFPLLSDPDAKVHKLYGAWGEKNLYGKKVQGVMRNTYVISTDGKVKAVFEKVVPENNARDVLSATRETQQVAARAR
ncbi:MAG TPA: thioredoxin-dependent thiol peroxidase [Candidatus Norongarragalinales archaeon]|jgi:peroxiredoxin Q/BCP|nr:thioredoxin-dependent thiol peroxidase [Candidatus Norongarragalinales archaeon]